MRPPAKTSAESWTATETGSGWLEKRMNATNELSATVDATALICPSVPTAYPATTVAATTPGVECAESAPMKLVIAIPAAASSTAASRVR